MKIISAFCIRFNQFMIKNNSKNKKYIKENCKSEKWNYKMLYLFIDRDIKFGVFSISNYHHQFKNQ